MQTVEQRINLANYYKKQVTHCERLAELNPDNRRYWIAAARKSLKSLNEVIATFEGTQNAPDLSPDQINLLSPKR